MCRAITHCILVFVTTSLLTFSYAGTSQVQTLAIVAREVFVKRNMMDDPRFLSFNANDSVLELRYRKGKRQYDLRSWNIKDGKENWHDAEAQLPITMSPHGLVIVVGRVLVTDKGGKHRAIRILRSADGEELSRYDHKAVGISNFAFDQAGTILIQSDLGGFRYLNVNKGGGEITPRFFIKSRAASHEGVFSPDLKRIAAPVFVNSALSDKCVLRVADIQTGRVLWNSNELKRLFFGLSHSPCGKWIVGSIADNTTRIWDAETGNELKKIVHGEDGKQPIYCCHAFNASGGWLATGSSNGKSNEVTLWEMPTAKKIITISVKETEIKHVAFNARGNMVAASCASSLYVWALSEPKATKKE
jgi:WD40 repeat protein